jgi:hypothetical protein
MGFLSRWFGRKPQASGSGDRGVLHFYVECAKCGEKLHVRAVPQTDAYLDYPEGSAQGVRTLHKEILGSACQNLMYLHVILDSSNRVVESRAEGCTVISREQFEAAQAGPRS